MSSPNPSFNVYAPTNPVLENVWSTEKPTKVGHYWLRGKKVTWISEVIEKGGVLVMDWGSPVSTCGHVLAWAGPIQPPQEGSAG